MDSGSPTQDTSVVPAKRARLETATKQTKHKNNNEDKADLAMDVEADPAPTDDGISKFTLFPKLPLELRNKIWGFAAPEPCVVVQRASKCPQPLILLVIYPQRVFGSLSVFRTI